MDWRYLVARREVVWCNPPWNDVYPWVARAVATPGLCGGFLLPARPDRAWFRLLCRTALVETFAGRVAYVDPTGQERMAPREGSIFAWFGLPKVGFSTALWRDPETGLYLCNDTPEYAA